MKNNNNKAFNSHEIIEIINIRFFQYITAVEQKKRKLQKGRHYRFLKYVHFVLNN